MSKIKSVEELKLIVASLKKKGKIVGLVTGCFDVLHIGHIELFRFAKQKVDILIVGVENDESVRLSKGKGHPVFSQQVRMSVLEDLNNIDYVFPIQYIAEFSSTKIISLYKNLVKRLSPSAIITASSADSSWKRKKRITIALGINFIECKRDRELLQSSSEIIDFFKERTLMTKGKIFESIYEEVRKIPKGKVATYGEIARKVGTFPRVVGFALHQNPDPKNIPCHRVVFKDGQLSAGYVFGGMDKQKLLLQNEGVIFDQSGKVASYIFTTFSQGNSSRPK